jgi:arylsulfatase
MKAAIILLAGLCSSVLAASRPNIIVILADDMGYSDIGCYGSEIATPNLDSLAKGGLRFTQFYNTARCCPTRASLLTGLHPHQAGIGHMMEDRGLDGYRGNLNRRCVTIAEALKPAGYRNYAVGKWHVTPGQSAAALADRHNWPLQRGFDRYYGTIHGAGSYWDPSALARDNKQISIANDPEYRPAEFYYTDAISDHAVRFIREHSRDHAIQPFFLYVAFTAAHWPMHAKDSDIAKYRGRYDAGYAAIREARLAKQKQLDVVDSKWTTSPIAGDWDRVRNREFESRCMEVYAAMVDCMDQGIGRIVAELRQQGQLDNTLILYLQDNGGCAETIGRGNNATNRADRPTLPVMAPDEFQVNSTPKQTRDGWPVRQGYGVMPGGPDTYIAYGREWANVSNVPFREYKHWVHEGGISTPLIAHWPSGIAESQRNRLVREPGQLMDIMATCVEVAGAKYPTEFAGQPITPLEGVSLRPLFEARPLQRPQPLVWEHEGNRAIRVGDWKLVAKGPRAAWELYDLAKDRTEMNDLASKEPERVKDLAARWDAWARRSNVLPWPWNEEESRTASTRTRFDLGPNANLPRAEAPDYVNRGFTVTVNIATPGTNGVLVAQGGAAHGWALYFDKGAFHFAINRNGNLEDVSTSDAAFAAAKSITAALAADSTLTLSADGREMLKKKVGALPATIPTDGLQVGRDLRGSVGDYATPFAFNGTISGVTLELGPR